MDGSGWPNPLVPVRGGQCKGLDVLQGANVNGWKVTMVVAKDAAPTMDLVDRTGVVGPLPRIQKGEWDFVTSKVWEKLPITCGVAFCQCHCLFLLLCVE